MLASLFFPLTLVFAAIGVQGIAITAPNNQTGWSTTGAQEVTWTSVDTDPSNFTIYFIYPNTTTTAQALIGNNVETSEGDYVYSPTRTLDAGSGYRINFVSASGGILAQSNYFTIAQGTSNVSTTSIYSATSVIGGPTTSQNSATTTAASSSSASASTTSAASGAERLAVPSVFLALLGAVAMLA